MPKQELSKEERRRLIRLNSVFPVGFRLVSPDGRSLLSDWLQGFTSNVGKGGLCLSVNNLPEAPEKLLRLSKASLSLKIELPLGGRAIEALASPAWVRRDTETGKYLIGLKYEKISPADSRAILRFALAGKYYPYALAGALVIACALLLINLFVSSGYKAQNRLLVSELVRVSEELAESRKQPQTPERTALLKKEQLRLEKANMEKMYGWLKSHQNPRTGLVMSFEGDSELKNWSFVYDQSLVLCAFAYFSDFDRCRKTLDFFSQSARKQGKFFFNAYDASDGTPAEYLVHSGPNIWLGIAAAQYTRLSKDTAYLPLAEEIAAAVMGLQDAEGGIPGGPQIAWYSTEHNLDAFAFFSMLYGLTGKDVYKRAADSIISWLLKYTYDEPAIPVKRGKGDSTIATDTYAWSIAALGPKRLKGLGLDPEMIMDFAEKNCAVEAGYLRPDGVKVTVKGFDFAPQRHLGRGGVVSAEWSAQMVLSFRIMAKFYRQNDQAELAEDYEKKAQMYLEELGKMVISSPSPSGQGEGCLPYATQDHVDTGHGWSTPAGEDTGSLAATSYAIFAYYGYNPLEF